MYKAAVIGDRHSVLGFRALGLTAVVATAGAEAARMLHEMARNKYAIVYMTEQLAAQIPQDIARYMDSPEISIIPIPSIDGSLGIGMQEMHQAVERAVGADILREAEL